MNKIKLISTLLITLICMNVSCFMAFANSTESTIIVDEPLTPSGNLTLIDDIAGASSEDKQFITMQSKNGNYFYLVIDRSNEEENVYFLNLVDEADLLALMEDAPVEVETPLICICKEQCSDGSVNTDCPVCITNKNACEGVEPEPETLPVIEEEVPHPEESKSNMPMCILAVVAVLLVVGGGAVYYLKFMKPKNENKGNLNLDEYDFEDDGEEIFLEDIAEELTEEE